MQPQDNTHPNHPAIALRQLIEEATRLAESSIPLVLLQHGLKAPIEGPDGSWIIVDDPDAVATAIEEVARGHPINIGAVLAPKSDSRLLVVDADGDGAWPKLREFGLSSSSSFWISRTGRGRLHIFGFCEGSPPQRKIRAGGLPVDLLSNGYAVLPPSNTYLEPKGGGPYRWVQGHSPADIPLCELDPLPGALLDWWHEVSGQASRPNGATSSGPRNAAWHLLAQVIPEGSRNETLTRIGGWLRLYHPIHVVEALLLVINESRCRPPLDPREIQAIVKSLGKYPQPGVNGHPRAAVPSFVRREAENG